MYKVVEILNILSVPCLHFVPLFILSPRCLHVFFIASSTKHLVTIMLKPGSEETACTDSYRKDGNGFLLLHSPTLLSSGVTG